VPTNIDTDDPVSVLAAAAVMRSRTVKTYSTESPYGTALVKLVKLVADADITLDDLPGWAASPQALREIIGH
jgi:hypothetical protein